MNTGVDDGKYFTQMYTPGEITLMEQHIRSVARMTICNKQGTFQAVTKKRYKVLLLKADFIFGLFKKQLKTQATNKVLTKRNDKKLTQIKVKMRETHQG